MTDLTIGKQRGDIWKDKPYKPFMLSHRSASCNSQLLLESLESSRVTQNASMESFCLIQLPRFWVLAAVSTG